mmetsp:Transcript_4285/g.19450  ORF Transcript_4285/g.19450 Transcript_4285/m.19450 type:complete len:362 (-) Transcript_4285:2-1087(-)
MPHVAHVVADDVQLLDRILGPRVLHVTPLPTPLEQVLRRRHHPAVLQRPVPRTGLVRRRRLLRPLNLQTRGLQTFLQLGYVVVQVEPFVRHPFRVRVEPGAGGVGVVVERGVPRAKVLVGHPQGLVPVQQVLYLPVRAVGGFEHRAQVPLVPQVPFDLVLGIFQVGSKSFLHPGQFAYLHLLLEPRLDLLRRLSFRRGPLRVVLLEELAEPDEGLLQLQVLSLERLFPSLESLLLQLVLGLARVERLLGLAHQPTLLQQTGGGIDVLEHHGVLHVLISSGTHVSGDTHATHDDDDDLNYSSSVAKTGTGSHRRTWRRPRAGPGVVRGVTSDGRLDETAQNGANVFASMMPSRGCGPRRVSL